VAPLFLRCQPQDLGLSAQVKSKHFLRPTLFLYDRVQGGVGLSEILFEEHRAVLRAALEVVTGCECAQGCPACVQPPEASGVLAKGTARRVLEHLCAGAEASECEPELVAAQEEPA